MKRIIPYILAVSALAGCVELESTNGNYNASNSRAKKGYYYNEYDDSQIRCLAGIIAGTARFSKNGSEIKGHYSEAVNPEAFREVLQRADTNYNKKVTSQELFNLRRRLLR